MKEKTTPQNSTG